MSLHTLVIGFVAFVTVAQTATSQVTQQSTASRGILELSSASSAAKAEFWLGVDDWQSFSYTSAQRHFDRAIALDPALGLARVFSAEAAALLGQPSRSADMERGVADATRASTAEGLLALAWREKATGREQAAATILRSVMDLLPNEPHVVSEYLWSLSGTDRKAALEVGRAQKTKFPTSGPLSVVISYLLLQAGDTTAALAEAERYTQLSPMQPGSFTWYGGLLQERGRYDEAEAQYRRSLTLAPRHADGTSDGVIALADLLQLRGNGAAARQVATEALQRATSLADSASYLRVLTGLALYAGDMKLAMSTFETLGRVAAPLGNGAGSAAALMALTNAVFGDGKSVRKYLSDVHILAPGDTTQVEMWFAGIYAYAGQSDSTLKYAAKLAARASANPLAGHVAHFARGQLHLALRQCDKALEEFRQSDSTWVEVQAGNVECEMQLGHRAEAMRWRDRALAKRDLTLFDPGEIHARVRMMQMRF